MTTTCNTCRYRNRCPEFSRWYDAGDIKNGGEKENIMRKNARLAQTMTNGELYRFAWAAVKMGIENTMKWEKPDDMEIKRLRAQEKELKELMEKSFAKREKEEKTMKYAVEARIFNSGKIVAKVRPARDGEEEGCTETRTCDIWVDLFDTEAEAQAFARDYKNA